MNDRERIAYLKRIIKEFPNTPKARNAKWLIKEIQDEAKVQRHTTCRNCGESFQKATRGQDCCSSECRVQLRICGTAQ